MINQGAEVELNPQYDGIKVQFISGKRDDDLGHNDSLSVFVDGKLVQNFVLSVLEVEMLKEVEFPIKCIADLGYNLRVNGWTLNIQKYQGGLAFDKGYFDWIKGSANMGYSTVGFVCTNEFAFLEAIKFAMKNPCEGYLQTTLPADVELYQY